MLLECPYRRECI
jgi:hypothetical protein